jgi:(p)ppGpp synthase/HD superfamily hydrolase
MTKAAAKRSLSSPPRVRRGAAAAGDRQAGSGSDIVTVTRAACFAAQAHTRQTRKGGNKEPYVNHLAEVAAMVADATSGEDANLIVAAWLHDAVEDQEIAPQTIAAQFGDDVAELVLEVTHDKSLPKQERKRLQVETTAAKSRRARLLKLADKTSNVQALVESPPLHWSRKRLQEYVRWAAAVVDNGCRGLNEALEARFDAAVERARAEFGS